VRVRVNIEWYGVYGKSETSIPIEPTPTKGTRGKCDKGIFGKGLGLKGFLDGRIQMSGLAEERR